MYWTNKQIWKDCLLATLLCVCGCSIGTMGVLYYLSGSNWFFVLLISLVVGYLSCMLFMIPWNMTIQKIAFKKALNNCYKMSLVSMLIMMLTENLVSFVVFSKSTLHHIHAHSSRGLQVMILAMFLGFLLALPYNYYQLQKHNTICH